LLPSQNLSPSQQSHQSGGADDHGQDEAGAKTACSIIEDVVHDVINIIAARKVVKIGEVGGIVIVTAAGGVVIVVTSGEIDIDIIASILFISAVWIALERTTLVRYFEGPAKFGWRKAAYLRATELSVVNADFADVAMH
jgi:hypothetical protein